MRTFGCQMNEHDSERIAGLLEADGHGRPPTDVEDADVVVLNTCCIRENADNKLYGTLGHLKSVKDRRPGLRDRGGRLPGPEGPRPHRGSGPPTSTWCSAPTTCTGPPSCSHERRERGRRSSRSSTRPWPTTTSCSPRPCRPAARSTTPPGSPSRSAATTPAPSASCPPCGARRSAGRSGDIVARGRARSPPTA